MKRDAMWFDEEPREIDWQKLRERFDSERAARDVLFESALAVVIHEVQAHPEHKNCASGCVLCDLARAIRAAVLKGGK